MSRVRVGLLVQGARECVRAYFSVAYSAVIGREVALAEASEASLLSILASYKSLTYLSHACWLCACRRAW